MQELRLELELVVQSELLSRLALSCEDDDEQSK
jgi:hypothetical protein